MQCIKSDSAGRFSRSLSESSSSVSSFNIEMVANPPNDDGRMLTSSIDVVQADKSPLINLGDHITFTTSCQHSLIPQDTSEDLLCKSAIYFARKTDAQGYQAVATKCFSVKHKTVQLTENIAVNIASSKSREEDCHNHEIIDVLGFSPKTASNEWQQFDQHLLLNQCIIEKCKAIIKSSKSNYREHIEKTLRVILSSHEKTYPEKKIKCYLQQANSTDDRKLIKFLKEIAEKELALSKAQSKELVTACFFEQVERKAIGKVANIISCGNGPNNIYLSQVTPISLHEPDELAQQKSKLNDRFITCRSNYFTDFHAANVWRTELYDKNNKALFCGIRHAVLASHTDDDAINISKAKATEIIKAALLLKYSEDIDQHISSHQPFSKPLLLRLTSTSLMTLIDIHAPLILNEKEKTLSTNQTRAFAYLSQHLKEINIKGCNVPINVQVCSFSAPMNELALGRYKLMNGDSWELSHEQNIKSLTHLFGSLNPDAPITGWAGEYLNKLETNNEQNKKIETITKLVREIKDIVNNKRYQHLTDDLFMLSRRIVYLSFLIDVVPAFNCKSGKDRTSLLDSEVKALSSYASTYSIDENRHAKFDDFRRAFYFDPANLKIQECNIGISGNKCMRYKMNYFNQFLTHEEIEILKGFCDYV